MDVSIIIVNYNIRDYLLECLRSVYAVKSPEVEVILVDNASSDGSVEAVRKEFPRTIIIENKENRGFPAANNQAFALAKGDYLMMLNPDAFLQEGSLESLYAYMQDHPEVSMTAPRLLNTDGSHQKSVWRFPALGSLFAETFYFGFLLKKKNYADRDLNVAFEAESFSGAAILFRRSVLETIGPLDESLFWIEDVDFCYRAAKARMKRVYYPAARVTHHISVSAKKNYNIAISNQIYNKIKFFKKHKSRASAAFVIAISLYHVLAKLILFSLLSPFSGVYRRKARAYAYTLPRVFNPPAGIC